MKKTGAIAFLFAFLSIAAFGQTAAQLKKAAELMKQGNEKYAAGNYDGAIADYTAYLKIRPAVAEAWFNRGVSYYLKGSLFKPDSNPQVHFEKAIADLSQAMKLKPKDPDSFLYRGKSYAVLMRLDMKKYMPLAAADLSQAIRLKPNSAELYKQRGAIYEEANYVDEALADLNMALSLNPKDAAALYLRSKIHGYRNDFDLAKADAEASLRLDPGNTITQGELDWIKKELQKSPVNWQAFNTKGNEALAKNDANNAAAFLERALAAMPPPGDNPYMKLQIAKDRALISENLAKAYLLKKDYDKSMEVYQQGQMGWYRALAEKFGEDVKTTLTDTRMILMDHLSRPALELVEMGKRSMSLYDNAPLTSEQRVKRLGLGLTKLAAGEFAADILHLNSRDNLSYALGCRDKYPKQCGPLSNKNEIPAYSSKALADISKAIETAPAIKKLYLQRAEVYKFLGRSDLAAADIAKAAQMK